MLPFIWISGVTLLLIYVFFVNIKSYTFLKNDPLYKNKKLNGLLNECKFAMKINLFLTSLKIVNWFNPFIWYAFYIMNEDSEVACDAAVLRLIQTKEKLKYGNMIISLYKLTSMQKGLIGITTLFKNKSQIKRRITMIAKFKKKSVICSIVVIAILVFIGAFTLTNGKKTIEKKVTSSISITKKKVSPSKSAKVPEPIKDVNATTTAITNTTNNAAQTTNKDNKTSSSNEVQNQQPAKSEPAKQPAKQITVVQPPKQNPITPVASSSQYVSNNLGFAITFPASWQDKYTVSENSNGIIVYFKPEQQVQSGEGKLFTIVKKDNENEGFLDTIGGPRYLTSKNILYVIGGPTDVNFPPDNPEFRVYRQLCTERASVVSTLKTIN